MIKELKKQLNLEDQKIPLNIQVPDEFYQSLLEELLERNYLADTGNMKFVNLYANAKDYKKKKKPLIHWLQITRLPIHPNDNENYDLMSRWQGVLTSLHAWGYRTYFLLLRHEGKTNLFLGTATSVQSISADEAVEQLRECAFGSMPGIGLQNIREGMEAYERINEPLQGMNAVGAVTGIPSLKETEQNSLLQTLDQLAFGIRDTYGMEKDYAMLVISDPIPDSEITDIISRHRRLASQIHSAVKLTGTEGQSRSESYDPKTAQKAGANLIGSVAGMILGASLGAPDVGRLIGAQIGGSVANTITSDMSRQQTVGGSSGLSMEYLDKFAEYAEVATNHHIDRLNAGRNFGFWNTGVYVLGAMPRDVVTVTGMLRSIYSGEETFYEPIRLHLFRNDSNALEIIRDNFDMPLMLDANIVTPQKGFEYEKDQWHLFGKYYQYLSTPITTKELGIATSLPRRDVPGLRFVKTAVRFANNPGDTGKDRIAIGNIVDTGIEQCSMYDIDVNSLVRHALVAGSTGSGKSTTCKKILSEILLPSNGRKREIPVLIVEPAKDDYVRWAIEMNRKLPKEKQFRIYMPGVTEFEGYPVEPLMLNPFEPACAKGARVDLLQHCETFITLLNACLPSEEVIPILIEETVFKTMEDWCTCNGVDYESGETEPLKHYPTMVELFDNVKEVMRDKNYEARVRDNFREILETRFKYLRRGRRGRILNVDHSTSFTDLFSQNVVINISRLSGTKDKALIMALLLQNLYEYCISCYENDAQYRKNAQKNQLLHLTLIEEAHNVLEKPEDSGNTGSPQKATADLFGNMLSEVRGYGQGFMIVDQVPTRLIDDAVKNTNYKIVHRLIAPDDQDVMASCMALREEQKYIIPALEKGNAIICGDEDDAAAWVKIPLECR